MVAVNLTIVAWVDDHQPGFVACTILDQQRDAQGRAVVIIDTAQPDGVESTVGKTRFTVLGEQVVALPPERV